MRPYIFQSYRHLANFKYIHQPLSKIRKDYKLHEDTAATEMRLTEGTQHELLETFWILQGEAYEMEKLGWILDTLPKNKIH